MKYSVGSRTNDEPFHITAVRSPVTRNLVSRFDDIRDEIVESFKEYIPLTEGKLEQKEAYTNGYLSHIYLDWTSVPAYDTLMHIVCRTSNRYFVGLPLCEYLRFSVRLDNLWSNPLSRPRTRLSIAQCRFESPDDQLFPKVPSAVCILSFRFLWLMINRFIATYLTTSRSDVARAFRYLGPTIESRIAQAKRPKSEQGEMPVRQPSLPYLWTYINQDDRTIWSAGWLNP